jgi:hypothetical protein
MRRKLGLAATVGAIAVALTFVLAACGGSSESEGVASLPDTTGTTDGSQGSDDGGSSQTDPRDAALAFAQCMRERGVDVPDPDASGGLQQTTRPGEEAEVERAQRACLPLLRNAGTQLTEDQQSVMQEAQLAFAKCMREHGVDYPDPKFGEGGRVEQRQSAGEGGMNPDDPKFREAQRACEPILREARRKAGVPDGEGGSTQSSGGAS